MLTVAGALAAELDVDLEPSDDSEVEPDPLELEPELADEPEPSEPVDESSDPLELAPELLLDELFTLGVDARVDVVLMTADAVFRESAGSCPEARRIRIVDQTATNSTAASATTRRRISRARRRRA